MYVTEKTFTRELGKVDRRFKAVGGRFDKVDKRLDKVDGRLDKIDGRLDGIEGRLGSIETEVSDMYSMIRDIFDEFYHKIVDEMHRIAGAAMEKYRSDVWTVGEKSDIFRKQCLDEHVELHHQDAMLAERIRKVESKSPAA